MSPEGSTKLSSTWPGLSESAGAPRRHVGDGAAAPRGVRQGVVAIAAVRAPARAVGVVEVRSDRDHQHDGADPSSDQSAGPRSAQHRQHHERAHGDQGGGLLGDEQGAGRGGNDQPGIDSSRRDRIGARPGDPDGGKGGDADQDGDEQVGVGREPVEPGVRRDARRRRHSEGRGGVPAAAGDGVPAAGVGEQQARRRRS